MPPDERWPRVKAEREIPPWPFFGVPGPLAPHRCRPSVALQVSSKELRLATFLKRRPMATPTITPRLVEPFRSAKRQLYTAGIAVVLAITPFVIWPRLSGRLLSADFLPHVYCYLRNPGLVWTHVVADSLIGISYFAISITMAYLVYQGRHDLPFRGLLTAYGLFIVACGAIFRAVQQLN